MKNRQNIILGLRSVQIIVIVLFVFFSIIFNYSHRSHLKQSIEELLGKDNLIISKEVNYFFDEHIQIVNLMVANQDLIDYARGVKMPEDKREHPLYNDVNEFLNYLKKVDKGSCDYWIAFNSITDYITDDPTFNPRYLYPDYQYLGRVWYQAMLDNGHGVTISPIFKGVTGEYYCAIFSPVMNEGEEDFAIEHNIAQMGVDVNVNEIAEFISNYQVGEEGFAILIDNSGNYIGIHESFSDNTNIFDEDEPLATLGDYMSKGVVGVEQLDKEGVDYYVAYAPVGVNDWAVASFIPASEVEAESIFFNILTILVIGAAIIIVIGGLVVGNLNNYNVALQGVNEKLKLQELELVEKNTEVQTAYEQLYASDEELRAQYDEIGVYTKELEKKEAYIAKLAYIDPLTNIPNRRKFIEILEVALRKNHNGAVILLDLDNFKEINDTLGHIYGDALLKEISLKLMSVISENSFVSRFGGDEFLILIDNEGEQDKITDILKKIVSEFNKKILLGDDEVFISVSVGAACYPKDGNNVNDLIMFADTAMYEVKNSGKNNFCLFDKGMAEKNLEKLEVGKVINSALLNHGFKLCYQPQININTGKIIGSEALLRLKEQKISPGVFIPIAEETGKIIEIGRWVTEEVIRQQVEWKNEGRKLYPVAINYSAKQMNDRAYLDFLKAKLAEYELEPEMIQIEITESVFLNNESETIDLLNGFKALGIKISLDDFGSGYSSLSYLTYVPVDKIKLDKTLFDRYLNKEDMDIISSILELVNSLKISAIAEGIETKEQIELLKVLNCKEVQGYFYSKPLDSEIYEKQYLV